ncbi:MAG: DNA-processing protein DprA [Planctomycetes bacterium]|nr:DNA-processing protein DprA [Planctomycetota bacterium]
MAELTENLIRLKSVAGVGNIILWRLIQQFGNSDRVFGATESQLRQVSGVSQDKARRILAAVSHDPRPELEKAVAAGIEIIPYDDPSYPRPLLFTPDPPVVLYVLGRLLPQDQVAVGIVGTRRASGYGRDTALSLSGTLARGGYTIVSGLARGIDTFAHIGALNAGGRTVGVLGCGFDHMYPEENRDLALEMTRSGAVISELPMATGPSRETFPARNRIIAGMSLGLLVVEAPVKSGAIITARVANDNGRTVFAVPGRVGDANSEGCNKLIRDGAVMVTTPDDIFDELNPSLPPPETPDRDRTLRPRSRRSTGRTRPQGGDGNGSGEEPATAVTPTENAPTLATAPTPDLTEDQAAILAALSGEWNSVDDIISASGVAAGRATASLAMLKIKRLVEQGPGQVYRLRKPGE